MNIDDIKTMKQEIADNQKPILMKLIKQATELDVDVQTYDYLKQTKVRVYASFEFAIPKGDK